MRDHQAQAQWAVQGLLVREAAGILIDTVIDGRFHRTRSPHRENKRPCRICASRCLNRSHSLQANWFTSGSWMRAWQSVLVTDLHMIFL